MAVPCGRRLVLSLQSCRPASLQRAFLATVPEDCQKATGRSELWKKRKKEKKPKQKYNSQGLGSSWEERLSSVVTPLSRLSYEEQLKVKYNNIKTVLETLASCLKELGADRPKVTQVPDGICCPLHPVVPSVRIGKQSSVWTTCLRSNPALSPLLPLTHGTATQKPVVNGYRNKSTFSVRQGPDGNPKTVGLYVGTGKGRDIVCVRADHLLNMPPAHLRVAQCYEKFLHQSALDPCLLFHTGGHWREIIVRTNRKGDSMAIVTFHPQHLSPEELNTQKELLKEFFVHGPGAVCGLTSLYFQESAMTRCTHQQSPFQLLYGEPHIFEDIMGLTFRISPDAFFQVNTAGAEVLYQTIGELCCASGNPVLLDVCCGTGAIGLSLANRVSRVIGIEVVEQAVEDARWNAALNGISNCEFHSGKAEVVLPQLLKVQTDSQALTAVVNPSRAGLHYRVVRAIRNCEAIRTLVYVSCKPDGEAMRNFIEYCCPADPRKKLTGEAFTPLVAVPVDLFPHTPHCELVLLFAR